MSVDIVLLVVLIVAGICFFRRLDASVYFIAWVDIFFRVLNFIAGHIGLPDVSKFINTYFPSSIEGVIQKYTGGIVETILLWIYVVMYIIFLFYTFKILWKKR